MGALIIDLCCGSGGWSQPYVDAGYEVLRFDLKTGADVRLIDAATIGKRNVHGILAAPPCTHLASSGARWWKDKGEAALLDALSMVDACLRIIWVHRPTWWAMENPKGRLSKFIGPPRLIFDPCDYGDSYTKRTLIWGDFTPPTPTPVEPTEGSKMHRMGESKARQALRSVTPPGFAQAFFVANP